MKFLFIQLTLLMIALFTGLSLEQNRVIPNLFNVVRKSYKQDELNSIFLIYFISHFIVYLVSRFINRDHLFKTTKPFVRELYYVTLGTVVSTFCVFLFTTIYFNISFFFGAYLVHISLYIVIFLGVGWYSRRDRESHWKWLTQLQFSTHLLRSVFYPSSLFILFLTCIPVAFFIGYKKDLRIASTINNVRLYFNAEGGSDHWNLSEAFKDLRFHQLIQVKLAPNEEDKIFALERSGKMFAVISSIEIKKELLLDFSKEVGVFEVENGAVGFNVHPEFGLKDSSNNGYVYVYYTHADSNNQWYCRLSRFDLSKDKMEDRLKSETILIEQKRSDSGYHNGASIEFGPDSFMYVSIGDANGKENHQRIDRNLFGGVLRIDVDMRGGTISHPIKRQPSSGNTAHYFIPNDNPFCDKADVLEEYWALGLRNPFRSSFDPETKELWVGDVGSSTYEEVNLISRGGNYQWPYGEGPKINENAKGTPLVGEEKAPIYYYHQDAYRRAIIGGFIYRGSKFKELYGNYICADNFGGYILRVDLQTKEIKDSVLTRTTFIGQMGITSLLQTSEGDIYVTVLGDYHKPTGRILKLEKSDSKENNSSENSPKSEDFTYESVSEKYSVYCTRCHGKDGKGIGNVFTDLNLVQVDFTSKDWQQRASDAHILSVIKKGGPAVGMSSAMPPWEPFFNDGELNLLLKKIRSFDAGGSP